MSDLRVDVQSGTASGPEESQPYHEHAARLSAGGFWVVPLAQGQPTRVDWGAVRSGARRRPDAERVRRLSAGQIRALPDGHPLGIACGPDSRDLECLELPSRSVGDQLYGGTDWGRFPLLLKSGELGRAEVPGGPCFLFYRRDRSQSGRDQQVPKFLSPGGSGPVRLHVAGAVVPIPGVPGREAAPGLPVLMPDSPSLSRVPKLRPWDVARLHHRAAALGEQAARPLPRLRASEGGDIDDDFRRRFNETIAWEELLPVIGFMEVSRLGQTTLWERWSHPWEDCATTSRGGVPWLDPLCPELRQLLGCNGCDKFSAYARLFRGRGYWNGAWAAARWLAARERAAA